MSIFLRLATITTVLTMCCLNAADDNPLLKLPSGHEVRIISIGVLEFSKDEPAWWLNYQTHVSMDKTDELRAEALEVWETYRNQADKSGRVNAALSANEPALNGSNSTAQMYNVVFKKQADGSWKML